MTALELVIGEVLGKVVSGKLTPSEATDLIHSLVVGIEQIRAGKDLTPDMIGAIFKGALPVIEAVAAVLYPGSDKAIALIAIIISMSRPMTQDEVNAWMDRASAPGVGG